MSDLPNGFTGMPRRDSNFVSAGDAIRRSESEARHASAASASARGARAAAGGAASARTAAGGAAATGAATSSGSFGWQAGSRTTDAVSERAASMWGTSTPTSKGMSRFLREAKPGDDAPASFDPEKLRTISGTDRRWSWVEIDLSAIRHNAMAVKSRLPRGCRLMAVVKADAYGHGAVRCAKTALNSGAEYLGVATVEEAIELREGLVNAPILILGEPPISAIPLLLAYKIMPAVYTAEFAIQYAEAADSLGLRAPFHLKVNTGMNRIGVRYDEVVPFMHQVGFHRALDLVGTFTHFATADCAETLDFHIQTKRFLEAVNALRSAGVNPGIVHAANSAAAIRYPDVHFDMVRLGISLYGFHPCADTYTMIDLKPAMSVHARITDTKLVPMSEGVSYGLHYRSPGSVKICTVPIGYADGLRRGLSGNTSFIVDGRALRQVGNICMDQCMFEVDLRTYGTRKRLDPQIGDEVLIVGAAGDAVVTIDEMADKLGTIQHEIAIGFGCSRMPRIYV